MPADWTVAFDDFFREVIQHCAACGRPAPRLRHATWVYMSPGTGREIAFAMGICHRCEYQPDWWTRVDQLYRLRYGLEPDGSVEVRRKAGP